MRLIGFSTGAVARGDFIAAISRVRPLGLPAIELSALRLGELRPLVRALPELDLDGFDYVSFHAPSRIDASDEAFVLREFQAVSEQDIPIVVHPDVMFTASEWRRLGRGLLIENMDKRKPIGRFARDLEELFSTYPEARFCFDAAHARQVDPTMIEARLMLESFGDRLAQVHMSELNTRSQHEPISAYAISAYQSLVDLIPETVPVILETLIDRGQSSVVMEVDRARRALAQRVEAVGEPAL